MMQTNTFIGVLLVVLVGLFLSIQFVAPDGFFNIGDIKAPNEGAVVRGQCVVTGCSSHVCADEEVITTCEYRPEYACFKSGVCERQSDGVCGWTETEELKACLENNSDGVESPR